MKNLFISDSDVILRAVIGTFFVLLVLENLILCHMSKKDSLEK